MKKVALFAVIVISMFLGYIIGVSAGKHQAIIGAQIVDVNDHEVYIDFGIELDNGHHESNVHLYEYNK